MSILLGPFLAVSAPATKAGLLRRCSCSAFVGGLTDTWVSATMQHSKQQKENYYHKGAATKVDSIVPCVFCAFAMDGPVLVGDGTQKVHASVVYNRSRSNQIKSGHNIIFYHMLLSCAYYNVAFSNCAIHHFKSANRSAFS